MYQPKTGEPCSCRRGVERDNCPHCEGTGQRIDFAAIRRAAGQRRPAPPSTKVNEGFGAVYHHYFAIPATGVSAQRPWSKRDLRDYYQGHPELAQLVGDELAEQIAYVFGEAQLDEFAAGGGGGRGWKLVHDDTGKEIMPGDVHTDFRGEKHTVLGGTPPRHSGSTGRVHLQAHEDGHKMEYYPSVINASWVKL